jgi:hypothetical protein
MKEPIEDILMKEELIIEEGHIKDLEKVFPETDIGKDLSIDRIIEKDLEKDLEKDREKDHEKDHTKDQMTLQYILLTDIRKN